MRTESCQYYGYELDIVHSIWVVLVLIFVGQVRCYNSISIDVLLPRNGLISEGSFDGGVGILGLT